MRNRMIAGLLSFGLLLFLSSQVIAQSPIPDAVLDIFDESCALSGCHFGPSAQKGLDLSEEFAASSLINQPSRDQGNRLLVKPGDPVNSYLMMKVRGAEGISGEQMPRGSAALGDPQIKTLEDWIAGMPAGTGSVAAPQREYALAFHGLSLSTLPTTQTMTPGLFSYRIGHRWRGTVESGFANFFGLDGGASVLIELAFPVTENIAFDVSRHNDNATFHLGGKWRFLREKNDGSVPVSLAIYAGVDWLTRKEIVDPDAPTSGEFLDRTSSERFHWFAQVPLSKQLHERFAVLLVPGVLINGNVNQGDEDPVITIGLGGRVVLSQGLSFFVEWVPIVSGEDGAFPVGGGRPDGDILTFNDAFTLGLERKIGGHVFHVYLTNSLGIAPSQYMSGGDLDFLDGDFRLGFNIYRELRLPF